MIEIKKRKEPRDLIKHRKTANATYDNMPTELKHKVLKSLVEEQGYLCAYCMCKIPQEKQLFPATIEHWEAQSDTSTDKALDYRNMLAVCNGNRGCGYKDGMTCDAHRGNTPLIINPLNPSTLLSIQYKSDGTIFSENSDIDNDLNKTLNLNCSQSGLVENRRKALQTMLTKIKNKAGTSDFIRYCEKELENFQSQTQKTPYVGILIWWLKKRISRGRSL